VSTIGLCRGGFVVWLELVSGVVAVIITIYYNRLFVIICISNWICWRRRQGTSDYNIKENKFAFLTIRGIALLSVCKWHCIIIYHYILLYYINKRIQYPIYIRPRDWSSSWG